MKKELKEQKNQVANHPDQPAEQSIHEVSEEFHQAMSVWMSGNSLDDTILKKIDKEHITQYLQMNQAHMERDYQERRESKLFAFAGILLFVVVIFGVISLLRDTNPEIMEKIIYAVGGTFLGGIGGYGYGKSTKE